MSCGLLGLDRWALPLLNVPGKPGTLFRPRATVAPNRQIPGRINAATGAIVLGNLANPQIDDVLDDLGALVLKAGGQVVIIPTERMPTETGVAALYRY